MLAVSLLALLLFPSVVAAQTLEGGDVGASTSEPADPEPEPQAPQPTQETPLVASVDERSVVLTWLDLAAASYRIERSADDGATWVVVADVDGTVLEHVDEDLADGVYAYRLFAADAQTAVADPVLAVVGGDGTIPEPTPETSEPAPQPPADGGAAPEPEPTPAPEPDPTPAPEPEPEPTAAPRNDGTAEPSNGVEEQDDGTEDAGAAVAAPSLPSGDGDAEPPRRVRVAGVTPQPLQAARRLHLLPVRTGLATMSRPIAAQPRPQLPKAASAARSDVRDAPHVLSVPPPSAPVTVTVAASPVDGRPNVPWLAVLAAVLVAICSWGHAARHLAERAPRRASNPS